MATDVVGYSRHMERDDAETLSRVQAIRKCLLDPKIAEHGGHVVKTTGDGMLLQFSSADAAVRCAVDVQRAMAADNQPKSLDDRIELRIGINLGDVIVEDGDIFGDGVNVAARLEALAEPGGICVSAAVHEQIHGSIDIDFHDIGEQHVKNIARPIRAFAVAFDEASGPSLLASRGAPSSHRRRITPYGRSALSANYVAAAVISGVIALVIAVSAYWWSSVHTSGPPSLSPMSIGVVALVPQPGDTTMAQKAEAWTRDLVSMLVRSDVMIRAVPSTPRSIEAGGGLAPISRALAVRYLLEGNVARRENATVVDLRLMNGATGDQISSERVTFNDDSSVEIRLLRTAAQHIRNSMLDSEIRRAMAEQPSDAAAADYVLRGRALLRTEPDTLQRALEQQKLFEEALRRDPNLVPALLGLYYALDKQNDNDFNVDHEQLVRRMDDVTSRAVNLNGAHPDTWALRAVALMYKGQWDAALEANANSIRLDPDDRRSISERAWLMSMSGRPEEALTLTNQAIAMESPGTWTEMRNACEAYLLLGEYTQAIATCRKAKGLSREDWIVDLFLAAAYAQAGDVANASIAKGEVLRHVPGYTIAVLKSRGYSVNPDYMRLAEKQWYSGLRMAGFPEQ